MQNEALKLIVVIVFSSLVTFTPLKLLYFLPLFVLLIIERKQFLLVFKKLLFLNLFTIFLVLFVAFENLYMAVELFCKINLILFFTLMLFSKSKGYDIIRGLNFFKVSPLFISLFYFTIKMIEFLIFEIREMKNSLTCRGFNANTSLFSYKTFGYLFALLLIKAIKKSEELYICMQARGFSGEIYLNPIQSINRYDIVLSSSLFAVILI